MTERVRSVSIEIDDEHGATTVIVRDPFGAARVYTAGPARAAEVQRVLEALGLSGAMAPASTAATSGAPRVSSRLAATPLDAISVRVPAADAVPGSDESATVLKAVVEAVLRAGRQSQTSTVDEALRSADEMLSARRLPTVARLLDHIESALRDESTVETATLALAAAGEAARVIESGSPTAIAAELSGTETELSDFESRALIEVGRYRERGRSHWETRLLVDITTGQLVRECGVSAPGDLSLGPPGRRLVVTLASKLESTEPSRVRISQYEYGPAASSADLERAVDQATRTVAVPPDVRANPLRLVALPRVIFVAPDFVEVGEGSEIVLRDGQGDELPVLRSLDPGGADALEEIVEDADVKVRAVAGALHVTPNGVGLHPWSAIVTGEDGLRHAQLAL